MECGCYTVVHVSELCVANHPSSSSACFTVTGSGWPRLLSVSTSLIFLKLGQKNQFKLNSGSFNLTHNE